MWLAGKHLLSTPEVLCQTKYEDDGQYVTIQAKIIIVYLKLHKP
jgi:hypothetical protein